LNPVQHIREETNLIHIARSASLRVKAAQEYVFPVGYILQIQVKGLTHFTFFTVDAVTKFGINS
jgi:hypothetical protein